MAISGFNSNVSTYTYGASASGASGASTSSGASGASASSGVTGTAPVQTQQTTVAYTAKAPGTSGVTGTPTLAGTPTLSASGASGTSGASGADPMEALKKAEAKADSIITLIKKAAAEKVGEMEDWYTKNINGDITEEAFMSGTEGYKVNYYPGITLEYNQFGLDLSIQPMLVNPRYVWENNQTVFKHDGHVLSGLPSRSELVDQLEIYFLNA